MKPWVTRAIELLTSTLQPPQHELNEIDWKGALSTDSKRLTEHLCAFSNHPGGGYFVFGVGTDGKLGGVSISQIEYIANRLSNLGRDAVEPSLQLDHMGFPFQGADLLFVHVPESLIKPVHRRGQPIDDTFIRSGGTTRKASRQEIGSMMMHSQTPRWEPKSSLRVAPKNPCQPPPPSPNLPNHCQHKRYLSKKVGTITPPIRYP